MVSGSSFFSKGLEDHPLPLKVDLYFMAEDEKAVRAEIVKDEVIFGGIAQAFTHCSLQRPIISLDALTFIICRAVVHLQTVQRSSLCNLIVFRKMVVAKQALSNIHLVNHLSHVDETGQVVLKTLTVIVVNLVVFLKKVATNQTRKNSPRVSTV